LKKESYDKIISPEEKGKGKGKYSMLWIILRKKFFLSQVKGKRITQLAYLKTENQSKNT
jgi:hypothetical protein